MSQTRKGSNDEQRERNRERMRHYRATRSAEQATIDRQRHAQCARIRRENMSPVTKARIRQQACLRARVKRASLSDEERALYRARNAEYQKLRRSRLSDQDREIIRKRNADRTRARRASNVSQVSTTTPATDHYSNTISQSCTGKQDLWEQPNFMLQSASNSCDDFNYFPFNVKSENHDVCEESQFWNCIGLMRNICLEGNMGREDLVSSDPVYYSY